MTDPDAAPFTDAEWTQAKPLVRRGRPMGSGTKTQVTLRLDAEVLAKFKATGDGWQTRINEALKNWVQTHA
nr:BrnA antitoxin family protein [Simplicispira psychrophila]